jgi:CheY-like chemotaxis protein
LASTVLRAYGGREAIDAARRELPDLIVVDLMMPEVNGSGVVEALKRHGKSPDRRGQPHKYDIGRIPAAVGGAYRAQR